MWVWVVVVDGLLLYCSVWETVDVVVAPPTRWWLERLLEAAAIPIPKQQQIQMGMPIMSAIQITHNTIPVIMIPTKTPIVQEKNLAIRNTNWGHVT